jgi:hypothetical protein
MSTLNIKENNPSEYIIALMRINSKLKKRYAVFSKK